MSYTTEFICGCLSGWSQVLTMQPFEIIKVRLVNQSLHHPLYDGMLDCFSKIYQEEGIKGFYKGTLTPLIGNGGQVAMQFGTN
jgi:solute carrier family 25 carnitine/acylcarnitine transporter 20/29